LLRNNVSYLQKLLYFAVFRLLCGPPYGAALSVEPVRLSVRASYLLDTGKPYKLVA